MVRPGNVFPIFYCLHRGFKTLKPFKVNINEGIIPICWGTTDCDFLQGQSNQESKPWKVKGWSFHPATPSRPFQSMRANVTGSRCRYRYRPSSSKATAANVHSNILSKNHQVVIVITALCLLGGGGKGNWRDKIHVQPKLQRLRVVVFFFLPFLNILRGLIPWLLQIAVKLLTGCWNKIHFMTGILVRGLCTQWKTDF